MSDAPQQAQIEKIVPGGLRLVRTDKGIVFLNEGLPGETVDYQLERKQKGTSYGHTLDIIKASPHRVEAGCSYYPPCGGCSLIETSLEHRRAIKWDMLFDAMRRIAKLDDESLALIEPIQFEPHPQGRIRATLHIAANGNYGFYEPKSHTLVSITECNALHPTLQNFMSDLALKPCPPTNQDWRLQIACDPNEKVAIALHDLHLDQQEIVAQHLLKHTSCSGVTFLHRDGHTVKTEGDTQLSGLIAGQHPEGPFYHDPATFTQSSFWGNEALLNAARGMLNQIDGPIETCIELFCGAGHFSFELLDRVEDLLCIEGDPRAYFWLSENRGKHAKQDQMEIWQTQIDGNRIDLLPDICPIDLLFMDPPREGVRHITQITEALKPKHIILVACDLANGARDLGLLCRKGYRLKQLHPLDIFAHNHHLEWIAQLERMPEDETC